MYITDCPHCRNKLYLQKVAPGNQLGCAVCMTTFHVKWDNNKLKQFNIKKGEYQNAVVLS